MTMKKDRMRILVIRPEPDAARTAEKLRASGHEVTVDSLLSVEAVPFDVPRQTYAALAVTSANALRVAGEAPALAKLKALPLYALGMQTANAARLAGFSNIEAAGGDASALAELLARRLPAGSRALYLAGEDRARDLAALTAAAKIAIETVIVYRAKAAARLQPATAAKLAAGEFGAVLHFSPRSAEIFLRLVREAGCEAALKTPRHLCLSAAVAAALAPAGIAAEVAARPDEAALLALLDL